jgi:phosphatidylserine synthase
MRLPDGMAPSIWLIVMQGAGILAAILVLAFMLPSYARLTRVNPEGEHAAYFDGLRRRQRIFGMISGMLALLALIAGGLVRLGM